MKLAETTRPSVKQNIYPLILVNFQFFLWGFIWNLNNVLIGLFRETFDLNNFRMSLLTSISFFAFFAMSYPAKLIISRIKTVNAIILGSGITGIGMLIFIPAALILSYPLFLVGTFLVFSGVTFLQISCNPYVRALGSPASAASRINFSQAMGAVGAFLTAYIGGGFILKLFANDPFKGIVWFYLILGVLFISMALLVKVANMPANPTDDCNHGEAEGLNTGNQRSAWDFRNFRRGFVVLLLYMGAEAILYQLMTPYFMGEVTTLTKARAVDISGLMFLGLMLGRLLGAGMLLRVNPGRLVGWFAALAALMIIVSMLTTGYAAIYTIVSTGFFISIMFATIYSLAIEGLGRYTNEASSFLIMAISGGFFIPLLFGLVADNFSVKTSLIIVVVPLLLAAWYGFLGAKKPKKSEKIR
ncbi:MAG: MFS transporter [Bacteroidales bacterium]|nr:MFS transporter [Bacteroidales bacterium]